MKFNADQFVHEVNHSFLKEEHEQRYGQYLMNYLFTHYPSLHAQTPQVADCFYLNSKCDEFLRWIYSFHDTEIHS